MKTLLLTLLLISSSIVAADKNYVRPGSEGTKIGTTTSYADIVGGIEGHYLDGCEERGFHLAAEELSKNVYKFHTYCGPAPEGVKRYRITKEDGI